MSLSLIIIKIISGAGLLVGGFLISHNLWFAKEPLYKVPYLGQVLFSFLSAAVGLYLIPYFFFHIAKAIKRWLTTIIKSSVSHSVGSFMASQAGRVREARGKASSVRRQIDDSGNVQRSTFNVDPVILDTSAIIDSRIFQVIKLGFVEGKIVVPDFVVAELQALADASDDLKRAKGRRGLDLLEAIKKEIGEKFVLLDEVVNGKDVDEKLLKLAKRLSAKIVTVDFNLNKAGRVTGVEILNVNDLANGLRTPLVPGDKVNIKIIHEGKDREQGVGYLEDGTMIVVEGCKAKIGEKVDVEISRFLQTSAGKMVFGKLLTP